MTHEVHFSLLREEVKFGKAQKRITSADEQCFHLLHLSLFREYIDKEFDCLKVGSIIMNGITCLFKFEMFLNPVMYKIFIW